MIAPLATVWFWYIVWFHVAVVLFCVIGIAVSVAELRESKRRARQRQALMAARRAREQRALKAWADEAAARRARELARAEEEKAK